MANRKRPQKQKSRHGQGHYEVRVALAHSATPRPSGNDYQRKPKHKGRGWDE